MTRARVVVWKLSEYLNEIAPALGKSQAQNVEDVLDSATKAYRKES